MERAWPARNRLSVNQGWEKASNYTMYRCFLTSGIAAPCYECHSNTRNHQNLHQQISSQLQAMSLQQVAKNCSFVRGAVMALQVFYALAEVCMGSHRNCLKNFCVR